MTSDGLYFHSFLENALFSIHSAFCYHQGLRRQTGCTWLDPSTTSPNPLRQKNLHGATQDSTFMVQMKGRWSARCTLMLRRGLWDNRGFFSPSARPPAGRGRKKAGFLRPGGHHLISLLLLKKRRARLGLSTQPCVLFRRVYPTRHLNSAQVPLSRTLISVRRAKEQVSRSPGTRGKEKARKGFSTPLPQPRED